MGDLMGYIMTDGPGVDRRTAVLSPASGRENGGAPLPGHPPAAEETASYSAQANVLIELRLALRCNIKRRTMSLLGHSRL